MNQNNAGLVADFLLLNPNRLTLVSISQIDDEALEYLRDEVHPRDCYNNSVKAALQLDAEYVVFGGVYLPKVGFACEHAWVETSKGVGYDATYQLHGGDEGGKYEYYSLYKVLLSEYLELAEALRGRPNYAIDFFALRRSAITKHLFERANK